MPSTSGSNGNGNGHAAAAVALNGNGNGASTSGCTSSSSSSPKASPRLLNTIDEDQNYVASGQLELAAVTAAEAASAAASSAASTTATTESSPPRSGLSAAGTPYSEPGGRWSQFRAYSVWQRTWQIWTFAIAFAWRYWLLGRKWSYPKKSKGGMSEEAVAARKRELAVWLREGLVRLGPTFIKIGQQFSTRVDVLSPEFVRELEKLQDNVPPFDKATALRILETNLGAPPAQVFKTFDETPLAAASLGQVHLATLKTGERVVVKVQRPGLKSLFDIDTKNIR